MFGDKFEKATADWPQTDVVKNKGCVHLSGQYEQPGLHRFSDIFYFMAGLLIMYFFFVGAKDSPGIFLPGFVVVLGVELAAYYFVWRPIMVSLLGKKVDVNIFPDKIQVRDGFRYKNYSRETSIEFRIERHHKALKEEQWEQAKNQRQARTYREAIEVVMQYGEKRIVIAAMLEKEMEKAKALVIRMQNWCKRFDQLGAHMAEGNVVAEDQDIGDFGPEPDIR